MEWWRKLMWKRLLEASDVREIGGRVRVEDGKGSGQDSVGKIRFRIR